MNVNFEKMVIEMTKAEAKEAGKYKSEKYSELLEIRAQFSTFKIVIKSAPKKKDTYKGLNYDYMIKYIDKYAAEHEEQKERVEEIRSEFDKMRGLADGKRSDFAKVASYGEIRAWFLRQFPEIKQYNEEIEKLREENRTAIEKKKSA